MVTGHRVSQVNGVNWVGKGPLLGDPTEVVDRSVSLDVVCGVCTLCTWTYSQGDPIRVLTPTT